MTDLVDNVNVQSDADRLAAIKGRLTTNYCGASRWVVPDVGWLVEQVEARWTTANSADNKRQGSGWRPDDEYGCWVPRHAVDRAIERFPDDFGAIDEADRHRVVRSIIVGCFYSGHWEHQSRDGSWIVVAFLARSGRRLRLRCKWADETKRNAIVVTVLSNSEATTHAEGSDA